MDPKGAIVIVCIVQLEEQLLIYNITQLVSIWYRIWTNNIQCNIVTLRSCINKHAWKPGRYQSQTKGVTIPIPVQANRISAKGRAEPPRCLALKTRGNNHNIIIIIMQFYFPHIHWLVEHWHRWYYVLYGKYLCHFVSSCLHPNSYNMQNYYDLVHSE